MPLSLRLRRLQHQQHAFAHNLEQLLARLTGDALDDGVSYALGDAGRRAVEEARVRLASCGD